MALTSLQLGEIVLRSDFGEQVTDTTGGGTIESRLPNHRWIITGELHIKSSLHGTEGWTQFFEYLYNTDIEMVMPQPAGIDLDERQRDLTITGARLRGASSIPVRGLATPMIGRMVKINDKIYLVGVRSSTTITLFPALQAPVAMDDVVEVRPNVTVKKGPNSVRQVSIPRDGRMYIDVEFIEKI